MSLELIANEDMDVDFSHSAGPPDLVYTGPVKITDPGFTVVTKSTKCKAGGKSICTNGLTYAWNVASAPCPHTSATYDFVAGAGSLVATAVKTKAEALAVLREGDASVCAGSWTLKVPPNTPIVCACNVEISAAGQTKAKAQ